MCLFARLLQTQREQCFLVHEKLKSRCISLPSISRFVCFMIHACNHTSAQQQRKWKSIVYVVQRISCEIGSRAVAGLWLFAVVSSLFSCLPHPPSSHVVYIRNIEHYLDGGEEYRECVRGETHIELYLYVFTVIRSTPFSQRLPSQPHTRYSRNVGRRLATVVQRPIKMQLDNVENEYRIETMKKTMRRLNGKWRCDRRVQ